MCKARADWLGTRNISLILLNKNLMVIFDWNSLFTTSSMVQEGIHFWNYLWNWLCLQIKRLLSRCMGSCFGLGILLLNFYKTSWSVFIVSYLGIKHILTILFLIFAFKHHITRCLNIFNFVGFFALERTLILFLDDMVLDFT